MKGSYKEQKITLSTVTRFESYAEKYPDRIAIVSEKGSLTYRALNEKANQLAHHLIAKQLKNNAIIAVALPRSEEFLVSILAILKAGHAYFPLDDAQPINRLHYLLNDTQSPLLITSHKSKSTFSRYLGEVVCLDSELQLNAEKTHNPNKINHGSDIAYVIYTSGSTGQPKGVLIDHNGLINYMIWFKQYCGCRPTDPIDFSSHVIFDMAVTTSIVALSLNLQIIICREDVKHDPRCYLDYLQKNRIRILKTTPSYFKLMITAAQNYPIPLPDLKSIVLGGENLQAFDCITWLTLYPKQRLFNEYGPTEATVAITQYTLTFKNRHQLKTSVPIGKPGFNMQCLLLNEQGEPVAPGQPGELYLSGQGLAQGYLNRPELTAERFVSLKTHLPSTRWYKTGDLCLELPDGNFEFLGRLDCQVKIRGYRVELGEIEACLRNHPFIKEAVVLAKDIADDEKQLIAYYLLKDNTSFQSPNELRNYAQDHLAQYMVPSHFIPVTHFPLTDNGKRDNQLLLQLKAPVTTNSEPITHKNLSSLEQNIINIWSCVFHCQTIDLNTNFFEIGGHSLNAAKIILKTEERLNKRIPLASVYENPTVRAFAHAVASAETIATTPVHEITQRTTPHIPLSDFQFLFWICSFFETEANRLNIIARKRVFGPLDGTALTLAFTTLLNHHDILSYQFFKCLPIQSIKKRITFQLAEYDLCQYSLTQQEIKLSLSLEELRNHYPWKKDKPLFLAKLFHLQNGYSELQISIPHIIFDDASEDILFNELSALYLQYQNQQTPSYTRKTPQYQQYITHEQQIRSQRIERDIVFWERYLQDTQLLVIPPAATLFKEKNSAFSTYFELSQELLQILPRISIQHHVNTADILCASIALALNKLAGHLNTQTIAMNLIRSVRSNDTFDNTLGCFIRLDLIKINVHHTTPLITLSKQIQQEKIRTEAYQECSSVLKCSCLYKPSLFKKGLITLLSYVFVLLFNNASLHPRILMRYGRLQKLKKKKRFMINVNMLNHFMNSTEDHHLFGQKLSKTPLHAYDLSTTPYILDFCFLRNGHTDYLVVSGNLDPAFRQRLGEEVIAALQDGYPG